ncbi:MAG: hypothetical protein AAFX76_03955 [Planctomycetota bacterium]
MSGPDRDASSPPPPSSPEDPAPAWLLTGDLPCLGDGYNLRGLVGPLVKCPECGHVNDLRDPTPWQKQDLPLGVRQREHWPASAAGAGFLVPFFACLTLIGVSAWSWLGLAVGVGVLLLWVGVWINLCRKFIRSARSPRWGLLVLVVTHLATGATLVGLISLIYMAIALQDPTLYPGASFAALAPLCLLAPIGFLAFLWLKQTLRQRDNNVTFRVDWKNYRIPV